MYSICRSVKKYTISCNLYVVCIRLNVTVKIERLQYSSLKRTDALKCFINVVYSGQSGSEISTL